MSSGTFFTWLSTCVDNGCDVRPTCDVNEDKWGDYCVPTWSEPYLANSLLHAQSLSWKMAEWEDIGSALLWYVTVCNVLLVQNGHHFMDALHKALKFIAKGPIDDKSVLVQAMAWCLIRYYLNKCWQSMASVGHKELTHGPLGDMML